MDLLKGYGSDDSSSSSSSSASDAANANRPTAASATRKESAVVPAPTPPPPNPTKSRTAKRGGKRILSLGAVLPPEIFDRLTRPPAEEDDSSTSSFEDIIADGNNNRGGQSKKRKRHPGNDNDNKQEYAGHGGENNGGGDRSELNSLLNELQSTPLQVSTKKTASKNGTSAKKDGKNEVAKNEKSEKLGMAFMSFTSTTTSKKINEVVDVHAVPKSVAKPTIPQTSRKGGEEKMSKPPPAPDRPSFSRMSAATPVATSFTRNIPQYAQAPSMPEYPAESQPDNPNEVAPMATASNTGKALPSYNNLDSTAPKSRRQRREEERALRSGRAFHDSSDAATTTEIHQPSPTEFAPTAHAAAIASRAARYHGAASGSGGGGGSVSNIAMYDPQSGTDVKGMGVTGKHRSKHQINQLMASAISLEAHRASEAELARFGAGAGGKGGGTRADAKRKYGW
mmetsp:Transcript_8253/g.20295  ORF Transcript_8253/g.20295 Transcript_8253/m.20295 type:complete len:453 (-) Transcript_8253:238-1596(-)